LLLETDQHELVDRIVVVDVPVDVQIARTVARDTSTEAQIQRIIEAQMPREERRKRADYVIDNASAPGNVDNSAKAQVAALNNQLLAEFQRTT